MTPEFWLTLAGIICLLAASFFFSGSETALTAASRARVHQLARGGSKAAGIVEILIRDKERLIGAILLGNNIVNILASTLAASMLIQLFGEAGIVYATVAMTAAVVVFSEVLPKTIAIARPDAFALVVAPAIRIVVTVFAPVTFAVQGLVNAILRLFGLDARGTAGVTAHDEIRGTLDLLHSEGEVIKSDRDRLGGLLDLNALQVSDIMVHRTRTVTLDIDAPVAELAQTVLDSGYTRIPLYRDNPDNIVSLLHAKDLLRAVLAAGGDFDRLDIKGIASPPWFIPETMRADIQLNAFLKRKSHFALVVDEYGAVQGHVTLEDILEEIVGAIADEHDDQTSGIARQSDGSLLLAGDLPIRDLNRALDWNLPDDDFTTVAGLVIHVAKAIPEPGEAFDFNGFSFFVLRKVRNRISQVRVQPIDPPRRE